MWIAVQFCSAVWTWAALFESGGDWGLSAFQDLPSWATLRMVLDALSILCPLDHLTCHYAYHQMYTNLFQFYFQLVVQLSWLLIFRRKFRISLELKIVRWLPTNTVTLLPKSKQSWIGRPPLEDYQISMHISVFLQNPHQMKIIKRLLSKKEIPEIQQRTIWMESSQPLWQKFAKWILGFSLKFQLKRRAFTLWRFW